jgi:hypothetical protein
MPSWLARRPILFRHRNEHMQLLILMKFESYIYELLCNPTTVQDRIPDVPCTVVQCTSTILHCTVRILTNNPSAYPWKVRQNEWNRDRSENARRPKAKTFPIRNRLARNGRCRRERHFHDVCKDIC